MKKLMLLSFLTALGIRIIFILFIPHQVMHNDSLHYNNIAVNLVTGHGYSIEADVPTARRAPVYPLFLAFIYLVLGLNNTLAVQIVQAVLSSFICLITYKIGKEVFTEKISRAAMFITAIYPVLAAYSGSVLTETLYAFFLALSTLYIIRAYKNNNLKDYIYAGAVFGVTNLTRPDSLLLPFFLLPFFLKPEFRVKKSAVNALVFVIVMLLPFIPWSARNYAKFNFIFPGHGGGLGALVRGNTWYISNNTTEFNPESHKKWNEYLEGIAKSHSEGETEKLLISDGISSTLKNPLKFAIWSLKRVPKFWISSHSAMFMISEPNSKYLAEKAYAKLTMKSILFALHCLLLVLTLIGIVYSFYTFKTAMPLAVMLLYCCIYIILDIPSRHHVPYMPYMILFASASLYAFRSKLEMRSADRGSPQL